MRAWVHCADWKLLTTVGKPKKNTTTRATIQ
jgi:hypothetical protein